MKPTLNQIFAFILILVILSMITALCLYSYKFPNTPQFVMFIIGYITGLLSLCGAYLFGSTKGSQNKDAMAADNQSKMVDALANSAPANIATITPLSPEPKLTIPATPTNNPSTAMSQQ